MNIRGLKKKKTGSAISECTGAQTGNVFLAYKQDAEIDQQVEDWKSSHDPVYEFKAEDHVEHKVWIVDDEKVINKLTGLFLTKIGILILPTATIAQPVLPRSGNPWVKMHLKMLRGS